MGNDLKYGLILGAVVLLIFIGYMVVRSNRGAEAEMAPTPSETFADFMSTDTMLDAQISTDMTGYVPPATGTFVVGGSVPITTYNPAVGAGATGAGATATGATGATGVNSFAGNTADGMPAMPDMTAASGQLGGQQTASGGQEYTIVSGDTLSSISKKFYGTTTKWQMIQEANASKISNPSRLVVGTKITIPNAVSSSSGAQTAPSGKTYTVAKGDSLYTIAAKMYQDGNKWHKIYDANRDKLSKPEAIKPGMTLVIP